MTKFTIWMDNDTWHVTIPATGTVKAQRERARRAIAREVRARQGDQRPVIRLGAVPSLVTIATSGSMGRHWKETS